MKISKLLHVLSVIVGLIGVVTLLGVVFNGSDDLVFGITAMHALACSGILVLIAIWFQIGAIHHMMLEKNGEII